MPVTIRRLTSTVRAEDGSGMLNDDAKEELIRTILARVKDELRADEDARRDNEMFERRSDKDMA